MQRPINLQLAFCLPALIYWSVIRNFEAMGNLETYESTLGADIFVYGQKKCPIRLSILLTMANTTLVQILLIGHPKRRRIKKLTNGKLTWRRRPAVTLTSGYMTYIQKS